MATKKPTTKTPTKTPTAKAPTTTTKKTYVDKTSSYNQELINKAQAYMTGTDYVAGKPVDTSFWGSSGGGGKNTLYGNAGTKTYAGKEFTAKDMNAIAKYVAEQDKLAANKALADAQNAGYNAAMGEVEGMVQSAIAPIQQMYANMQSQQNAALQNANKLNQEQINSNYDNSAREYYRLYKTQQKQLPETLSRLGVTGGASESSQLKLLNSYSDNLYKNQSARNNQLAGVNADYNNQIAENSINAANQMANSYLQLAQQQLSYKRQDELAQKEAQAQAEENAAAQTVAQWNANVRARMEEQLAKGDTIWTWTDESGKIHWTTYESRGLAMGGKKLSPSSSKVKTTGGSGGGTGGGGGGTPRTPLLPQEMPANASSGVSYDDVLKQATLRLNTPVAGNNRITNSLYGAQGALKYIINSGLSEANQKKMARQLGLI